MAVYPHHLRDHFLGRRARAIHGHHRRKTGAPQAHARIALKTALVPDARAYRRLGQLEQHRRRPADEQRNRIGEHAPGNAVLRRQRRLAGGLAEVEGHAGGRAHQLL